MVVEVVTRVLWEAASEWSLCPEEGWSAFLANRTAESTQPGTPLLLYNSVNASAPPMCIRVLALFGGETVVLYVSYKGRISPFHINTLDFKRTEQKEGNTEQLGDSLSVERLKKHFHLTVFAPLLQPNRELPALCLLSHTSLTGIFAYMLAQELCQAAQACKALSAASAQDVLWGRLLERDFPPVPGPASSTAVQPGGATPHSSTPASSSNSTATAVSDRTEASAKERYRGRFVQQARQRRHLEQQRRQWEEAQRQPQLWQPPFPPPWLPGQWGEVPSWAPVLPPLSLPYAPAGPPPFTLGPAPPHWPQPPGSGYNGPAFEHGPL